jgi:ubiquinone/menaquinone biosynthesis C-methylase UbiE
MSLVSEEPAREEEKTPAGPPSRYETLWDEYALFWDAEPYFRRFRFIGDEWGSDDWVRQIVDTYAAPYLRAESRVLEIGPGGGRYTVRLAPLCAELACVDVSGEMIARLKRRLAHFGHVSYQKGNGRDLSAIGTSSQNFVFSFNVFVQLAIEDVYGYLSEIARILAPGGVAALHYACLSGEEGWKHFLSQREKWAADPCQRGRFGELTLATMDLLADRAGLSVDRNQIVSRDAMVVLRKPGSARAARQEREQRDGGEGTRRDFRFVDRYLDELASDVHDEAPTGHHAAAARGAIDQMVKGLEVKSALELGCGTGPCLDRLKELGIAARGVSLGAEPCAHPVVQADIHFTALPERGVDLVVARHILEHSPMPLLLLMEMRRLTRRYALVVVPCDEKIFVDAKNHYSVLSKPLWRKLFTRARFRVLKEADGSLEPASTEWRFLLERT